MTNDIPLARRDVIASRLANGQSVVANTLALEFEVSEDAIRRDLRALAAEGLCRRVYGGALPIAGISAPMVVRKKEGQERKSLLAEKGAELIHRGALVFLDSGSTNLALGQYLPEDYDLTVVTNSIDIAASLMQRTDIKLIVIGGMVTPSVGGSVDGNALLAIQNLNIDIAFIGVCGLSVDSGLMAFHPDDAVFKRALIKASRKRVALITTEKINLSAPHRLTPLNELNHIVIEHDIPEDCFESLVEAGIPVLRAAPTLAIP